MALNNICSFPIKKIIKSNYYNLSAQEDLKMMLPPSCILSLQGQMLETCIYVHQSK